MTYANYDELVAVVVSDEPCERDGTYVSLYDDHAEWLGNFDDVRAAVEWLESNGYRVAYPEQEDDWGDPVNRMMVDVYKGEATVAVYGRDRER